MTRRLGVLIAAVVWATHFPLQAHHAIGETYDEERTIVLEGPGAYRLYLLNLAVTASDSRLATTSDSSLCAPTLRGPAASPTASR